MNNDAIVISDLHFSYGRKETLRGVNLNVPSGSIFGFLGRNGAGKTTTIKTLLGLLTPSTGTCLVQGLNPGAEPLAVRAGLGYMAEDQQMYGWMKVDEIVNWVAEFYPAWDHRLSDQLLDSLALPRKNKVKTLSKGQNSRLALLLALGHRPKLVILDDPTLGLDPIARKDFLKNVLGLLQANNVTVFFSSHLLYEIEPVADYVAILDDGKIIKTAKTDDLRENIRRFIISPKNNGDFTHLPGLLDASRFGDTVSIVVESADNIRRTAIQNLSSSPIRETALNLDEIFEAYVIGNRGLAGRSLVREEPAHA
jgi:ABC-2 type transport system ATP-binding protein